MPAAILALILRLTASPGKSWFEPGAANADATRRFVPLSITLFGTGVPLMVIDARSNCPRGSASVKHSPNEGLQEFGAMSGGEAAAGNAATGPTLRMSAMNVTVDPAVDPPLHVIVARTSGE